jgi:hypothetical protein
LNTHDTAQIRPSKYGVSLSDFDAGLLGPLTLAFAGGSGSGVVILQLERSFISRMTL